MAVKRSQSASRVLAVLDLVAARQPIGVSALAKALDEDKSAVQRAVMTLADAGWIRPAPEPPTRWELTAHIFTLAQLPHSSHDLRQRARRVLEALRDETGETIFLALPDIGQFVVVEVADSPHTLRMALKTGQIIPARGSATSRAVLAYLRPDRLEAMLGGPPTPADLAEFEATRARGYGLSAGEVTAGSTNLAVPIFDGEGQPVASIGVSGPSDRITPDRHAHVGALAVEAARSLSRGAPKAAAAA